MVISEHRFHQLVNSYFILVFQLASQASKPCTALTNLVQYRVLVSTRSALDRQDSQCFRRWVLRWRVVVIFGSARQESLFDRSAGRKG